MQHNLTPLRQESSCLHINLKPDFSSYPYFGQNPTVSLIVQIHTQYLTVFFLSFPLILVLFFHFLTILPEGLLVGTAPGYLPVPWNPHCPFFLALASVLQNFASCRVPHTDVPVLENGGVLLSTLPCTGYHLGVNQIPWCTARFPQFPHFSSFLTFTFHFFCPWPCPSWSCRTTRRVSTLTLYRGVHLNHVT